MGEFDSEWNSTQNDLFSGNLSKGLGGSASQANFCHPHPPPLPHRSALFLGRCRILDVSLRDKLFIKHCDPVCVFARWPSRRTQPGSSQRVWIGFSFSETRVESHGNKAFTYCAEACSEDTGYSKTLFECRSRHIPLRTVILIAFFAR